MSIKKIIIGVCAALLVALLIFLITRQEAPYSDVTNEEDPITEDNNIYFNEPEFEGIVVGLDDFDINWIEVPFVHKSLRFEYAGEGLYLLEAVLPDGSSLFGFMDDTGSIKIDVAYNHANIFTYGLAYVELDGHSYFIDPTGTKVLNIGTNASGLPFEHGFARINRMVMEEIAGGVRINHYSFLIDTTGNEILAEFEDAGAFENGILWAVQDNLYAIFNSDGTRITSHEFESLSYAGEDMIVAQKNGRFGHIDRNGNVVVPFEFDMVGNFTDGLAFVISYGRSGYVNIAGEQVTPIHFEAANEFREGRAAVMLNGFYGFIDTDGTEAVPFIYDEVWDFNNGVAIVVELVGRAATRVSTIDKYGEIVIVPEAIGLFKWNDTRVAFNDPSLGFGGVNFNILALLSDDGMRLTDFRFSDISDFENGLAAVQIPSEPTLFYGIINQNGTEIVPPVLERLKITGTAYAIIQYQEVSPTTGATRSRVGIMTLPNDAPTRPNEMLGNE